jgi:uncharacterized membrane protein YfcA
MNPHTVLWTYIVLLLVGGLIGAIFCVFMIYQFDLTVMSAGLVILIIGAVVYRLRREKII